MKKQFVSICSAYKAVDNEALTILPSSSIQITPNAYQILYENSYNPGAVCFKDIPPYGVFTIRQRRDSSQQIQIDYISTQETDFPCRINTSITLEEDRMNAASHLLELLEISIWKRISTYDSASSQPQYSLNHYINNSICVMFSGGIDCSILACLLCRVLQKHNLSWVIELVNIAYGEMIEKKEKESFKQLEQMIPDRFTACMNIRYNNDNRSIIC